MVTARDVMRNPPETVSPEDGLSAVVAFPGDHGATRLSVVDVGEPVGIDGREDGPRGLIEREVPA